MIINDDKNLNHKNQVRISITQRKGGIVINSAQRIKVLLVDDSVMFRATVRSGMTCHTEIEIVGEASDAFEARDKIIDLKPDVLVMDIVMPKMDGLTFLKQLMGQYPIPCIMISGSDSEKDAKAAGAAGFVQKPAATDDKKAFIDLLSNKISVAAKNRATQPAASVAAIAKNVEVKIDGLIPTGPAASKHGRIPPNMPTNLDIAKLSQRYQEGYVVALGASTGGTDALECVLKSFPTTIPPVVVVQHMPPVFTKLYSERMDKCCAIHVKEAADGDRLTQGMCVIGAGGLHLELKKDARGYYVRCYQGDKVSGHCPSVDVLFKSTAETAGRKSISALMTGMGADGAKGLLQLKNSGGYTIGQDRESCVVYGMPMEAYKLGACREQQPLANIGKAICKRLTDGW